MKRHDKADRVNKLIAAGYVVRSGARVTLSEKGWNEVTVRAP